MSEQANDGRGQRPGCSEALSRLLDGELDDDGCRELFARLSSDAEARRQWVLLNVACDAVRSSETAARHSAGFVSRVSVALAQEPVVLAPRAMRRQGMVRRMLVPAIAVAAAAAVLAVVAVPLLRDAPVPGNQVARGADEVTRSPKLEAYLDAHRESALGPLSSPGEYVTNATLTTESR